MRRCKRRRVADFGLPFPRGREKLCAHYANSRRLNGFSHQVLAVAGSQPQAPAHRGGGGVAGVAGLVFSQDPAAAAGTGRRPGLHAVPDESAAGHDGAAGGGRLFADRKAIRRHGGGAAGAVAGGGGAVQRDPLCGRAGAISKLPRGERQQPAGGDGQDRRGGLPGIAGQTGRGAVGVSRSGVGLWGFAGSHRGEVFHRPGL